MYDHLLYDLCVRMHVYMNVCLVNVRSMYLCMYANICIYSTVYYMYMYCICMYVYICISFVQKNSLDSVSTTSCIVPGVKGISKILTTETIQYPDIKALELSKFFIPKSVFRNTDIVEYRGGLYTYITGSKYTSTLEHKVHLDYYNNDKNGQNRSHTTAKRKINNNNNNNNDGPLVPFEP